jgi:nucleoside-diphosphate-sugar epimerase
MYSNAPKGHPESAVIFGGSGFIGRHMAEYLVANGTRRIVLADLHEPEWNVIGADFERCDVREPIELDISNVDLIVNLAAVHRTPGHEDHEYHETNEQGATNVVAFAESIDCNRIWFTSSIAVYGPDEQPKTETTAPTPTSAYGKSKLAAEGIHKNWARSGEGRRLTISRPGTVYGPGEGGNFTRLAASMKRHTFVYPGRRDTLKACGYVRDIGPAFEFMESVAGPTALFNFAYPAPPTIEDVCNAMAEAGHLPVPHVRAPAPLLLTAGSILSATGMESFRPARIRKLMTSTNIRGQQLADRGFNFQFDLSSSMSDWLANSNEGTFV